MNKYKVQEEQLMTNIKWLLEYICKLLMSVGMCPTGSQPQWFLEIYKPPKKIKNPSSPQQTDTTTHKLLVYGCFSAEFGGFPLLCLSSSLLFFMSFKAQREVQSQKCF